MKSGKITLSTAVPVELKERVQNIADDRHWSLSQTMALFLEQYLPIWEKELGVSPPSTKFTSDKKD